MKKPIKITPSQRLEAQAKRIELQKLWKARLDKLPYSQAEFCRRYKKLNNYEANLCRAASLKMIPTEKTFKIVEAALKRAGV